MTTGIFKRTALVAALATTGVVAQADTLPFSFYALLDAGVVSTKISGGTAGAGNTTEVRSSPIDPSFWGIVAEKKVDDLIGGIQMESTINTTNYSGTDTGNHNALADRQANVYANQFQFQKRKRSNKNKPNQILVRRISRRLLKKQSAIFLMATSCKWCYLSVCRNHFMRHRFRYIVRFVA